MGDYTELKLNVKLIEDVPDQVVSILEYMLDSSGECPELPKHPLFKTHRWTWMLTCDSSYFDATTKSELLYDEVLGVYTLNTQSNFKNYGSELEHFLSWIEPYVSTQGIWGHYQNEYLPEPNVIRRVEGRI